MNIYRQGDVLIMRVEEAPAAELTAVPRDSGRVVLAYGEVTGHAHAISNRRAALYSKPGTDDRVLRIRGKSVVKLMHEEHATIDLPPGDYIVRRQREYHPQELRYVAD